MVKLKCGLEIHAYLLTNEKLFCRCKASRERGLESNINICPTCTGQPGAKPMSPNLNAVEKAVQIASMLGCKVNSNLPWMRKHYDWPDLPKGYQNTMSGAHAVPLGINGKFENINIESMHLEEDPAAWDPKTGETDYNRSGLPLVEIVTAPEFKSADEVYHWVNKLVHALNYLKAVDSNAGVKADVNVSLIDDSGKQKTERVEVKNITSIDAMKAAIIYEFERQSKEGSIRETRRYDESKGITMRMRSKEKEDDYRFIEDPDLMSVELNKNFIDNQRKLIPELPSVKLEKLIKKYKIDAKNAAILARDVDIVEFFEKVGDKIDGKFALPWITVELLRVLNYNNKKLNDVSISVEHFTKLLHMVKDKKITELQAKQILNKFVPQSFDPSKTEGKIESEKELEPIIKKILKEHEKVVIDYINGDVKSFNYLIGEVMRATNRRADSNIVRKLLDKLIKK
ncbi:Asp-tRNA(Asn)/Glu-tRNA(Gln) amidotransferase subunit GatB [Candidatus Pacearchaeota archaeon]|nr:Asp-tRNA(Asn)/Glu-tRNA(Gln) amidotransferase subunit GatB [Candidatus Pacearchaeota archaeon]